MKPRKKFKKVKWLFGKEIEIPEEWKIKKLMKLCTKKPEYGSGDAALPYDSNLPRYVRITDIDNDGKLKNGKVSVSLHSNKQYVLEHNDFLFARTGSVGRTFLFFQDYGLCVYAGYLIRFKLDKQKILPIFLYYYTHSTNYWVWLTSEITHGVQPNINAQQYSKLPIILPLLPEQTKIASILSGVDADIEKTQDVIGKAEMLKKGLMQDLLTRGIGHTKFKQVKWYHGKEIWIPDGWEWSELGKEGSLSSGATPRRDHPEYYNGNILWVSSGELDYNVIIATVEKLTEQGLQKTNLKVYPEGTFLFAITGLEAKGTRGRCAILGTKATTNQSCMTFTNSNSLDTQFLFYYFLTFGEKIIFALAQGTKQQSLNLGLSKKIKVLVPPLTEQAKIASILSRVDAYIRCVMLTICSDLRIKIHGTLITICFYL